MKRVVSIQDISCLGKCSLTVALPIISAMGVETCVVPTAVLSTPVSYTHLGRNPSLQLQMATPGRPIQSP